MDKRIKNQAKYLDMELCGWPKLLVQISEAKAIQNFEQTIQLKNKTHCFIVSVVVEVVVAITVTMR